MYTPFNLDDPNQYAGVSDSPAQAMDPAAIQTGIIARLQAQQASGLALASLANLEVAGFPDDPESYRAVNPTGTILVRYLGSEYGNVEDIGIVVQSREMTFQVGIIASGLGWSDAAGVSNQGAYQILQACLTALLGYRVPGALGETRAKRDQFIRRDNQGRNWLYAVDVIVPSAVIATPDAETIPAFTDGTLNVDVNEVATDTVDTSNGEF